MNDWMERCHKYTFVDGKSGFQINFAGMKFQDPAIIEMSARFESVHAEMQKIEMGEIKNPDENRKVTHFTDRSVYTGSAEFQAVEDFAQAVRTGAIKGSTGKKFEAAYINGIGGSALGPQLLQMAVNGPYWNEKSDAARNGNLKIYFLDNTDTAGLADALEVTDLETTLVINISKSGGTRETRNNMIAMEDFYASRGLDFARHAVAVTMKDSELDRHARSGSWLKVFEMADSIGGRTSETSIVGHVPAALTGVDFKKFLSGACAMDAWTRNSDAVSNPAMMLAAMWYISGNGKGDRNMVIVPYSDRLVLLSRYLQQLVMESLGKELDLDGKVVHQGLNVFGNKGGTDAHAFIQQLNDGRDDFFATFIEVQKDAAKLLIDGTTGMGDYLHGFFEGLCAALLAKGRQVITIRVPELSEFELGQLIALYERAVAMYAEFININAFHQPGVQAYKLAAKDALALREKLFAALENKQGFSGDAAAFAALNSAPEKAVAIDSLLSRAAVNGEIVSRNFTSGKWVYTVK